MCGIAGVLRFDGGPVDATLLKRMTDRLAHRGPDGEGHWIGAGGSLGLGHRRLAVIDLSPEAAQPMQRAGRFVITYNGEIYNYLELRAQLAGKGHRFATRSDTEVILAAYEEWGESCLSAFDGMFAFALWDERERRLFCARDRFGEKPFFFRHSPGHEFVFASEMKALFVAGVPRRTDPARLFDYLAHDVVQDPCDAERSFFEGVQSLEPARWLAVSLAAGGPAPSRRYWTLPAAAERTDLGLPEAAERFAGLLRESVTRRLRADVPVGTSLSGGLDSSSVVCMVSEILGSGAGIQKTFSARFRDPALDEGAFQQRVVAGRPLTPHEVWPAAEGLATALDTLFAHQEEPFGSASVFAQWEVMRLARDEDTVVLLDGQGADETLAGYVHFFRPYFLGLKRRDAPRFRQERAAYEERYGRPWTSDARFRLEARAPHVLARLGTLKRLFAAPEGSDWLRPDFVAPNRGRRPPFRSFTGLDDALRFFSVDYGLRNLLRFADRNSMAFSREVRLPFLSHELVEFAFTLPEEYKIGAGWTKRILREAMKGILPEDVRLRVAKLGFEPPQATWMQAPPMRALIEDARAFLVRERILKDAALRPEHEWRVLMACRALRPLA